MKCEHCGSTVAAPTATRVSIYGMYDMHLFHNIGGNSVDEVIALWQQHNKEPHPANVAGNYVGDLGKSCLCPAIVMSGDKELRRVGPMVFKDDEKIEEYRAALKADPDIATLLKQA